MHGNFFLAFWHTFHWNCCQIWSQDSLRHLLGVLLVNFDICQFLATPGPFEYFDQNLGSSENQFFLNEGATGHQSILGVLGGQVPRLYGGTIFGEAGGCDTLGRSGGALSPKVSFFKIIVKFF